MTLTRLSVTQVRSNVVCCCDDLACHLCLTNGDVVCWMLIVYAQGVGASATPRYPVNIGHQDEMAAEGETLPAS